MNINKLTITPLMSKTSALVIDNPSPDRAAILIKQKLQYSYGVQKPIKPKMPKFLRGFVNPKTYVGKAIDV